MNSNKKILVVDDNSVHLFLIESILHDKGYEVVIADHPNKAIELIHSVKYHLIILDLMMPDMDGFEFMDRKEKTGLNKETPVIVVSARTDSWSIKNAMDKGARDYLTKPINNEEVIRKIRDILKNPNS
ncbi:MAG: hypothetical protein A2X13_04895 [Bacteroidetes bacterium GWC2_33_15]|nr:MAG: hypothetical protein A2X10_12765 [Bacteroidetes bacterium GWA2_33_15]OFX50931.1 MAG: hypothetical protein A2X13_04895 [Bacteroidetes bacterium GWC2_33_15]OFX66564.1 MAG: hypothetical protein A2X15_15465 [Bacteroidetes bacterium GWB2_32_14]OFX70157.1 MAG: hypothetical protein A2X14_12655 [Bacteroidetes bacterium GWD2_33_33]HAN20032.1 hypothetical protein [Bacteroidales bacterium]